MCYLRCSLQLIVYRREHIRGHISGDISQLENIWTGVPTGNVFKNFNPNIH